MIRSASLSCLFLFLFLCPGLSFAATIFEIDPTQSDLTVGVSLLGTGFTEQAPGSLTTTYSGTIDATLTNPLDSTTAITFNSAIAVAANSGSWQPDGTGLLSGDPGYSPTPGNYGLFTPNLLSQMVYIAIHNVQFNLTGDKNNQTLSFLPGGYSDINAGALDNLLANPLAGGAVNANAASYIPDGSGLGTLTIPVGIAFITSVNVGDPFGDVPVTITLDGQFVAQSIPEPSSWLLFSIVSTVVASGRFLIKRFQRQSS